MVRSEQIDKFAEALAKAQGAMRNPGRDRPVEVETKTGSKYSFKYATLDALIDAARAALSENAIAWMQAPEHSEKGVLVVTTLLMHASGQWVETEIPVVLGREFSAQQMGSAITYAKRYAFGAAVGLTGDEDDDGGLAAGNFVRDRVKGATQQGYRQGTQMAQGARQAGRQADAPTSPPSPPVPPQEGAQGGRHFVLSFPPDTFTGRVVERKFPANGNGARDFLTNLIRGLGTNRKLIDIQENKDAVQAIRAWAASDPERNSWAIDLITEAETLAAKPMDLAP
jgi:hypothetical protein